MIGSLREAGGAFTDYTAVVKQSANLLMHVAAAACCLLYAA